MKIFILPGLDGTGLLLSDVAEMLRPAHEVIVVRYASDVICYQDLKAKVEEILPSSDYIIVAESFSGPLAAMIAAQKPKGLRGVVFVATFAKTPIKVPNLLTYLVDIAPIKSPIFMRLMQPLVMGRWATPEFTKKFTRAMKEVPATTIAARLREILKVDVTEQLASIEVPTIYLAAGSDRLVPSGMASDFKGSADAVYEIDGPHFLLQANAAKSSEIISDFSDRIA